MKRKLIKVKAWAVVVQGRIPSQWRMNIFYSRKSARIDAASWDSAKVIRVTITEDK